MTAEQRAQLLAALDAGDPVRAVTIALQIAATLARARDDRALAIRYLVDAHQRRDQMEHEYRRQRLAIAVQLAAGTRQGDRAQCFADAEALLKENGTRPVPKGD